MYLLSYPLFKIKLLPSFSPINRSGIRITPCSPLIRGGLGMKLQPGGMVGQQGRGGSGKCEMISARELRRSSAFLYNLFSQYNQGLSLFISLFESVNSLMSSSPHFYFLLSKKCNLYRRAI